MKKSPDNTGDGVKYAASDKGADEQFQKDFENDVDAVLSRQYTKQKGMLIIGRTPKVYTDIGLNQLPLTIAPIEIDAEVRGSNGTIDSNNVASYFDRGNLNALIQEAVAKEYNGETGFYFIDKKRATAILKKSGQQLPSVLMTDNSNVIIRNISENVNRKISHFTQTLQFKRWFGDWQAVCRRA